MASRCAWNYPRCMGGNICWRGWLIGSTSLAGTCLVVTLGFDVFISCFVWWWWWTRHFVIVKAFNSERVERVEGACRDADR